MTSPDSGNGGCGAPFLFIVLLVLSGFGAFFYVVPSESSITGGSARPDAPPPYVELVIVPAEGSATAEDMSRAYDIINQRLLALSDNRRISFSTSELRDGGRILVTLNASALDDPQFIPLLTATGVLELVDLPSLSPDQAQALVGSILTDAYTPLLTSDDVIGAHALPDDFGGYLIEIDLTPEGAARLAEWSEANVGSVLAIVVDGVVLSAPIMQTRVETPVVLRGNFTEAEAYALAAQLNTDPLPVELEIESMGAVAE